MFRRFKLFLVGPRQHIVAKLLGQPEPEPMLFCADPWMVVDTNYMRWNDWPELWVDRVHDACWG